MMEQLSAVLAAALAQMQQLTNLHELEQFKALYVGKQGAITAFMQQLKNIAPEARKAFGA